MVGRKYTMFDYHSIRSVHLEISTRCNASCPLCPRNLAGYDTDLGYPIHDMTLDECQRIFTPDFVKQLTNLLINGNFGDFVTARDGLEIVRYFHDNNPNIKILISTNGSAKPAIWSKLGAIPNVTVGFDLDGLEDTHGLYRQNTNWQTVITNAKNFIAAGGQAVWRMVRFDHNLHQIDACKTMSQELGFAKFEILDDGRDTGPVYDRDGKFSHRLGNDAKFKNSPYPEKAVIWKEWSEPGARPSNRLDQYKIIPVKQSVDCFSKKMSEVYVTATGEVYPCCWIGMYPKLDFKHSWQSDNFQVQSIAKNNNALETGLEESIKWFSAIENSWNKSSYFKGRLFKCDEYCGKN